MALTRKFLKAMGIEDEKIDQIIEAHTETTEALKAERDKFKGEADDAGSLKSELEALKKNNSNSSDYEAKYKELEKEFKTYKADIENKEAFSRKSEAYRKLLKDSGISEKRIDSVLRLAKADGIIDKIQFDGDNVKDTDGIMTAIKTDYADYIEIQSQNGAKVPNPPAAPARSFSASDIRKMSPAEINSNWDAIKTTLNSKGE